MKKSVYVMGIWQVELRVSAVADYDNSFVSVVFVINAQDAENAIGIAKAEYPVGQEAEHTDGYQIDVSGCKLVSVRRVSQVEEGTRVVIARGPVEDS